MKRSNSAAGRKKKLVILDPQQQGPPSRGGSRRGSFVDKNNSLRDALSTHFKLKIAAGLKEHSRVLTSELDDQSRDKFDELISG